MKWFSDRPILIAPIIGLLSAILLPQHSNAGETHLELRAKYVRICFTCNIRGASPYGSPMTGGEIYADYQPYKLGSYIRVGVYGSISTIEFANERVATGLALSARPLDSSWEAFMQIGVRYMTEPMTYYVREVERHQSQLAYNLVLGLRYYVLDNFYVIAALEHDSNSCKFRALYIGHRGESCGNNAGVDSAMLGFGWRFQ